jgi:hypothetical protein
VKDKIGFSSQVVDDERATDKIDTTEKHIELIERFKRTTISISDSLPMEYFISFISSEPYRHIWPKMYIEDLDSTMQI